MQANEVFSKTSIKFGDCPHLMKSWLGFLERSESKRMREKIYILKMSQKLSRMFSMPYL